MNDDMEVTRFFVPDIDNFPVDFNEIFKERLKNGITSPIQVIWMREENAKEHL